MIVFPFLFLGAVFHDNPKSVHNSTFSYPHFTLFPVKYLKSASSSSDRCSRLPGRLIKAHQLIKSLQPSEGIQTDMWWGLKCCTAQWLYGWWSTGLIISHVQTSGCCYVTIRYMCMPTDTYWTTICISIYRLAVIISHWLHSLDAAGFPVADWLYSEAERFLECRAAFMASRSP